MKTVDLLIVGAGPAGMSAAITARGCGLDVMLVDEQTSPGGQIWRAIEMTRARDVILGPSYTEGRAIAETFRKSGAIYRANAKLWQIEPGYRAYMTEQGQAKEIGAKAIILATGAQERPTPFKGWTLPGVMTVGAAQILLKNAGQIPADPVWIAGCGPLPLLYAMQLLEAGGKIAGFLDTTPPGQWRAGLKHLPNALRAFSDLMKGARWSALLRTKTNYLTGISGLEAIGPQQLQSISYRTKSGATARVDAKVLLVHEGVVPNIHPALSLNCDIAWNNAQDSFAPVLDAWGESSQPELFIAGDGAGIGGAKAAVLRGKLAALRVAEKLGHIDNDALFDAARPVRKKLKRELAARPFLDAMFKPRPEIFAPADDAIICRCEEITAGMLRAAAKTGEPGPNKVKTATRIGMGPCQGRQCGYTLTRVLCTEQNRSPSDVGYLNIRPPLKPATLGEIASLNKA